MLEKDKNKTQALKQALEKIDRDEAKMKGVRHGVSI